MSSDSSPITLSIVVACRNERGQVAQFLDSLLCQQFGATPWEAIVADGMSDDGTAEILREYAARDSRLRVIANPDRITPSGLNAAIRSARGSLILRMDVHTMYSPDYCRRCVETLERTGAENVGGPARTLARGKWGAAIAAAYHSPFSTGGARFHQDDYEGWVDTVPYGCWRRATFDRIGLFDETLVRNQDDEWNLRLRRSGGRIWQSPAIVSWYVPRSRLPDLFRQYFQYGFWKVAVICKHRTADSWRHLVPVAFLAANFVLPVGTLAGSPLCGFLWLAMLSIYCVLNAVASVLAASRNSWSILPYLPVIFAAYHLSYGAGFLAGLACLPARKSRSDIRAMAFTQISR